MVWKGSGYRDFFSRTNLIVLAVMYIAYIAINIITWFTVYVDLKDTESLDYHVFLPKITSLFYITYFIGAIFYHGRCKKIARKGNATIREDEDPLTHVDVIDAREAVKIPD